MTSHAAREIVLVGAGPDTGNQGVTALCVSLVDGLARRGQGPITVLDHGRGRRRAQWRLGERLLSFDRVGAVNGRRLHRPENMRHMRLVARAGGLWSESARALCRARIVLDVSGGDSFGDLYGWSRFRTVTLPKLIALDRGVPLGLLPQTYGPYRSSRALGVARRILAGARSAWARDAESFGRMAELLDGRVDPAMHHSGVDVAFGLPATPPRVGLSQRLASWLHRPRRAPLVAVNVSGLLFGGARRPAEEYGLTADYAEAMTGFVGRLLEHTDAQVLLVPHVKVRRPGGECDLAACETLAARLDARRERVMVLSADLDAAELKWILGGVDWLCGARMHATIAGLSSGVPTAALAYSLKTRGVFDTAGQASSVIDLRRETTARVMERLMHSFASREACRRKLAAALPGIRGRAEAQMDAIAELVSNTDMPACAA